MSSRNRVACSTQPITKTKGAVTTIVKSGFIPTLLPVSHKVTNAPNMMNWPWATLRTRPTPYCRLKPTDTRA